MNMFLPLSCRAPRRASLGAFRRRDAAQGSQSVTICHNLSQSVTIDRITKMKSKSQ